MALYRLTATGSLPGEEFTFGLHVEGSAGDSAGAAHAFNIALTAMWQDVTDGIEVVFSTDVVVLAAHAAELDPVTHKQIDGAEETVSLPGTDSGDMLPHEVAIAVTTLAASRARMNQGRFYLPPPSVAQITNGRLNSTPQTRIKNATKILIDDLQGSGFTPVIKHQDWTTVPIAFIKVGDVPDVQRRRRNRLVDAYVQIGV
jgi:hypothetical protein